MLINERISRRQAALNRGIERFVQTFVIVLRNTPGIFQRVFIAATQREPAYFRGQINFSTVFGAVIISADLAVSC